MTTNVQTTGHASTALAALGNLKQGLQNVQQRLPEAGGTPFLKMERDGAWVYGQDNVEVEKGSLWAVNPLTFRHGYINWKKRPDSSKEKAELLGEALVPMHQTPPMKESLPVYEQGEWTDCISVQMACVSGEDSKPTPQQVVYKTNSKGGVGAVKELLGAIIARPDGDPNVVPVLELKSDSYANKTYGGKTYFPVLEPTRWAALGDSELPDEPAPQTPDATQAPKEAPAAQQQEQIKEPEQAPAQTAADTGERRRRRRA